MGGIRLLFGVNRIEQVGRLVAELGGSRVLLITDRGMAEAGHASRAQTALEESGAEVSCFDRVQSNPSEQLVHSTAEHGSRARADFIVALGGGSVLDCAKGANFVLSNGGRISDYWGFNKAGQAMLPSVAVPTTAGTGSEAQSFALISQDGTGTKMACGDQRARFRAVILDPTLAASAPREVAGVSGLDALSHVVESHVSTRANPISRLYSAAAWKLLVSNLEAAIGTSTLPEDPWGAMLLGAHLAGAAIEQSMLGAAHACANPLTTQFDLTHGAAVALMLPHVVRLNGRYSELVARRYAELLDLVGVEFDDPVETLARHLEDLRDKAQLAGTLAECGVPAESWESLARQAGEQWTAQFNPVSLSSQNLLELYQHAS